MLRNEENLSGELSKKNKDCTFEFENQNFAQFWVSVPFCQLIIIVLFTTITFLGCCPGLSSISLFLEIPHVM